MRSELVGIAGGTPFLPRVPPVTQSDAERDERRALPEPKSRLTPAAAEEKSAQASWLVGLVDDCRTAQSHQPNFSGSVDLAPLINNTSQPIHPADGIT